MKKNSRFFLAAFLALSFFSIAGCTAGESQNGDDSDDDAASGDDAGDDAEDDHFGDDEAGGGDPVSDDLSVRVISEYRSIPGTAAPNNPITGDKTTAYFNQIPFYRFRAANGRGTQRNVSSVVLLVPGYTVGANSLIYMADSLVRLSHGKVETWVLDHRHHLLEDQLGMSAAEEAKDPRIAYRYYFLDSKILGQRFKGFLDPYNRDSAMMSEWGLDLEMKDLRLLIGHIHSTQPGAAIFLGGHSRGVVSVEAYASYVFDDGRQGCDELAGLVFIDGDNRYRPWMNEEDYLWNLQELRAGKKSRYVTLPPFGPPLYFTAEIMAMAASREFENPDDPELGPEGVLETKGMFDFFTPTLFRFKNIRMTNEAFVGFIVDDETGLIDLLMCHVGSLNGPTARDFLGVYPTDENHLYRWNSYDEVDPPEYTDIQNVIQALYKGPSNAFDPYYSSRLIQDFAAADRMDTEGTWREKYFLMRTSQMDAPVYALGTELISGTDRYQEYRDRLPPVRGQTLPRTQFGFVTDLRPDWGHIDTVFARAETNGFFHDLLGFIDQFTDYEQGR